jgi:hypothetical protein
MVVAAFVVILAAPIGLLFGILASLSLRKE